MASTAYKSGMSSSIRPYGTEQSTGQKENLEGLTI